MSDDGKKDEADAGPPPFAAQNQSMAESGAQAARANQEQRDRQMRVAAGSMSLTGGVAILTIHAPLPEDHPFYRLIGRVASEWAHLEHILDLVIWKLLGAPEHLAACVTSQIMGVGPRCKAIGVLGSAKGLSDEILKPFRQLTNDSYPIADWRARYVHDPWYVEAGSGKAAQFRAMPVVDPRYGPQEIPESDVLDTIANIRKLQDRANKARDAVHRALGS